MMSPEAKQKLQLALLVAMVIAGLHSGYVLYQRHQDKVEAEKKLRAKDLGYSNADYYVSPKKLHPYDLKSAKQLTQQPVWAKEGYRYTYYPYAPARKQVDFVHDAGTLLPLEQLNIKDVITAVPFGSGTRRQVVATFEKGGKSYAVPIGFEADEQFTLYSDEMFFVEDPRDLYKHWSADVWQSVEQHQVKEGMNEMQAVFAIGMGVPDGSSNSYSKIVHYPNGGKPLTVIYRDGKAIEIKAGSTGS
jgi:hypothetical protein